MVAGGTTSLLFFITGAFAVYLRYLETRIRNDSEIIKERIKSEKEWIEEDKASELIEGINLVLNDISEPVRKAVTACTAIAALYGVISYILQILCVFLTNECMGSTTLLIIQAIALFSLLIPTFYVYDTHKSLEQDYKKIRKGTDLAFDVVAQEKVRKRLINQGP